MKRTSLQIALAALALPALCGIGHADPAPATKGMGMAVMPKDLPATGSDVATAAQVREMQLKSKAGELAPVGTDHDAWSIEKTSQFIHFGDETTLVPKGAVLNVPARLKENIVPAPVGNIITWTEFAARHRGLLTFLDVDLDQASGVKPLDAGKMKSARDSGLIVIALYQHSPISVALPAGANGIDPAANSDSPRR